MTALISDLGYLAGATRFRRLSEKLHYQGDKVYIDNQVEFRASWFSVFYTLSSTDKPLTVLELADCIGFTHITVKNIVRELEQEGLAKIIANPADKRSKHILLTVEGRQLYERLVPVWQNFSRALEQILQAGHPDILNILQRIDKEAERASLLHRVKELNDSPQIIILDYRPSLKNAFADLAEPWLSSVTGSSLEEEDMFTLHHPDKAYLDKGGFLFFALIDDRPVGCVALKRLSEDSFEFCKLFVDPIARKTGIATKLIERCITRCRENNATALWLQTTAHAADAHRLYYKLGFKDNEPPVNMEVLQRTTKIMSLYFKN